MSKQHQITLSLTTAELRIVRHALHLEFRDAERQDAPDDHLDLIDNLTAEVNRQTRIAGGMSYSELIERGAEIISQQKMMNCQSTSDMLPTEKIQHHLDFVALVQEREQIKKFISELA